MPNINGTFIELFTSVGDSSWTGAFSADKITYKRAGGEVSTGGTLPLTPHVQTQPTATLQQ